MKFSVLMSIYSKDQADFFNQAMSSISSQQSLPADEIILVQDGVLTPELYNAISAWQSTLKSVLKTVVLPQNVGLGDALKIGLEHCSYEIIARMDADDIARPDRFKRQIKYMQDHPDCDIVGSAVTEFYDNPEVIVSSRIVPLTQCDIANSAQLKSPFNHPSVMYKKSVIIAAGGYQKFHGFEDYYLWVRLIMNGANCANISDALVNMRTGYAMVGRRGGVGYAINEIKLQYKFLSIGFISFFVFIRNLAIRIPVRLLPNKMRCFVYNFIRKLSH
ncbi:putative glycosyltransferase [uncultured Candidatus Thioglobus sp.]|nr:putative glycosyltransferase [uncultured Candidatus Thioglobus sp.]